MDTQRDTIAQNLRHVRSQIEHAAQRCRRDPSEITLVAVTKRVSLEAIGFAYEEGIRDFGESYVQEAREKLAAASTMWPDVKWHFIGQLQSNKVRDVVGPYALIHSVHSLERARQIGRRAEAVGVSVSILLEVRLDTAESKRGFDPCETIESCRCADQIVGVKLCGLMGVPPAFDNPEEARVHFRTLYNLFTQLPPHARKTLSMGMTADYVVAIEEGANLVRVGTGIFGPRQ